MTNQPKALPSIGSLISDSWKLFTSKWNVSVKTSILFLYAGLVYFAGGILAKKFPGFSNFGILISLAVGLFTAWVGIRLIIRTLLLEADKTPLNSDEEGRKAMGVFISMIWVGLLTSLATFGAFLLLVIPGIYFGIALYFSELFLIDKGIRGTKALAASRDLVRGRWWDAFGRILAGSVLFGGIMAIAAGSVMLLLDPVLKLPETDPFYVGLAQFIQMAVMAAFMPLLIGFQVKLYQQLQKTI